MPSPTTTTSRTTSRQRSRGHATTRGRTRGRVTPWLLVAAVLLAACGGDGEGNGASTAPGAAADATRIEAGDTSLGQIVVADDGMSLYLFTNDTRGQSSACEGTCLTAWPPLLTEGGVATGDGLDASLAGTITRADGTLQVTYGGWPLYTYAPDQAPGDVTGQDVGGVWYVVGLDGEAITGDAPAPAASTGSSSPADDEYGY